MLDPDFKAKWCEALRSGDYQQGHRSLVIPAQPRRDSKEEPAFCCLGVALEILGWNRDCGGITYSRLQKEVGLDDSAQAHLMKMNDSMKRPFSEIADYIEKHL